MAFEAAYAINGGRITGPLLRLMQESATRSGSGIIEKTHLAVRPLSVPGTAVRVGSGACVIRGVERAWQGSYYGYNLGDAVVDITATGSTAGRSDLIVARAEDTTLTSSPWSLPPDMALADYPVIFPRVIQGVPAGTTEVPEGLGYSAIPLARLDIPASTATITQSMISDVRKMADPRTQRVVRVQRGIEPVETLGNITDYYENAPNLVWPEILIPEWAGQVQLIGHWMNMFHGSEDLAGGSGSTDARGRARLALGYGTGGGPTDIISNSIAYNFNLNTSNAERRSFGVADQQLIPAAMRGQMANLRMQVQGTEGIRGRLRCDGWSNYYADLEFLEVPVLDVEP